MAIRIEFLAWHSLRPLSAAEIERRLGAVEGFYSHSYHDRFVKRGAVGHTGLAVWLPRVNGLAKLAGAADGALAYASHLPFGISRHVDVKASCTPADVLALHEKVRGRPEIMTTLGVPLNLVHLAVNGALHINNDYRGLAEVFHYAGVDGLKVWSSRLSMPLVFALADPQESVEGAQLRAMFTYFPHAHTPFGNVERVAGGTSVFAGDWSGAPLVTRRKLLLEMLGAAYAQQGAPVDYGKCRDGVAAMLGETRLFWSGQTRSGLTGGRDSRAVLGFLIAGGLTDKVSLLTTKILKQDYEVAAALVERTRRAGHPVSWELAERPPSSYTAANEKAAWDDFPAGRAQVPPSGRAWRSMPGYHFEQNALLDRMVFQFHRLDGQTMPLGYYTSPSSERPGDEPRLMMGGQSGEVLRASDYTLEALQGGAEHWKWRRERRKFQRSLAWIRPRDPTTPFTSEAKAQSLRAWNVYFEDAHAAGVDSFLAFDYMNVVGKQSRRVDVPKQLLLVCPLSHPDLLTESYKLTPEQRLGNQFHVELIKASAPYLLEAPFSFQLPKDKADLRLDLTGKPQFWDANAVPGFAEIIAEKARWADTFDAVSINTEFGARAKPQLTEYQRDSIAGLLLWRSAQSAYARVLSDYIGRQRKALELAA